MNEALFTPPRDDCDTSRYSAPDVMGSEREVSRFLAALVDLLHPEYVLETGSYLGHTSQAIGEALFKQGYGHLDSIEIDEDDAERARMTCFGLPVTIHTCDSRAFVSDHRYDLMFFDSSIGDREAEMRRFRNYASNRCVWVLHDSRNPNLAKLGGFQLPTPRGLSLGRFT